jgi:hypothetical protein
MKKVKELNRLAPSPRVMQARQRVARLRDALCPVYARTNFELENAHSDHAGVLSEDTRTSIEFVGEWAYGTQTLEELEIAAKRLILVVKSYDDEVQSQKALQCLLEAIKESQNTKDAREWCFAARKTIRATNRENLGKAMTAFDAAIATLGSLENALKPAPVVALELNGLTLSKWFSF